MATRKIKKWYQRVNWLMVAMAVPAVLLGAIGAWVSYWHGVDVHVWLDQTDHQAHRLAPLLPDMIMAVCSVPAFAKSAPPAARLLARVFLVGGLAWSLGYNLAALLLVDPVVGMWPIIIAVLIAVAAPLTLFGAIEIILRVFVPVAPVTTRRERKARDERKARLAAERELKALRASLAGSQQSARVNGRVPELQAA